MNRAIDTFFPRLWRVNKELAIKTFNNNKESPFPFTIPYHLETYIRWYLPGEWEKNKKIWEYIEFCEEIRGAPATKCRSEDSIDYVKPFDLNHFIFYEYKKQNFVVGR